MKNAVRKMNTMKNILFFYEIFLNLKHIVKASFPIFKYFDAFENKMVNRYRQLHMSYYFSITLKVKKSSK
jgi:hypothetical protein